MFFLNPTEREAEEVLVERRLSPEAEQWKRLEELFEDPEGLEQELDDFFDEGFFAQGNPFEEMRKFRKQLERQLKNQGDDQGQVDAFDNWYGGRFGGGTLNEIHLKEDDQYIYYEIVIKDLNSTSVKASVEGNDLSITGESVSGRDSESFSTTVTRSFPLPAQAKAETMQMIPEAGMVVIRFQKKK